MIRRTAGLALAWFLAVATSTGVGQSVPASRPFTCPKADGYHGIWAARGEMLGEFKYQCSGGLATYSAQHAPMACYSPAADKTFFVYGGMPADGHVAEENHVLLVMVSFFDHKTGTVARPRVLENRAAPDPEDNPVLSLDSKGHIWVFVGAPGTARPAHIYRSTEPYSVDAFELVRETAFSFPQIWYVDGKGFLLLHTLYKGPVAQLCMTTSTDGVKWSEPVVLAAIEAGHYAVSWQHKDKIGMAFEYHPYRSAEEARSNLYYMETRDFGKTWLTARGEPLDLPLAAVSNKALVYDYAAPGMLIYVKGLTFDPRGNPVILYLTAKRSRPGPPGGPRIWATARWVGRQWEMTGTIRSDSVFDSACIIAEKPNLWWLIGTTDPGPQPFYSGGEVADWWTKDQASSWFRRMLTGNSRFNHNFVRCPLNGNPGFWVFWADGDPRQPSESRLYFADKEGNTYCLPWTMKDEFEKPALMPKPVKKSATRPSGPSTQSAPGPRLDPLPPTRPSR